MYQGSLAQKSVPVLDTPGPVYQLAKGPTDVVGAAGPFDHADRFEPLKHLMISDEHNKRMGEAKGGYPGPGTYNNEYYNFSTQQERSAAKQKPGVYTAGEGPRFTNKIYGGPGMKVGIGEEGNGPGTFDPKDSTLKTNGPKIPRSGRQVGSSNVMGQVPGPGAYKPPLKHGHQGHRPPFGTKRFPKAECDKTPGPIYTVTQEAFPNDKPCFSLMRAKRDAKIYISKKHTQDIKGLDSPGPVYHFRKDKDIGTGKSALVGTSERNRSEAKRFISKLHTADSVGVGVPGPGAYGESVLVERGTGGFSFGTAERNTTGASSGKAPGPGQYMFGSTLKKGGCSFGGGPSRC